MKLIIIPVCIVRPTAAKRVGRQNEVLQRSEPNTGGTIHSG
jgi:hypothetical protein